MIVKLFDWFISSTPVKKWFYRQVITEKVSSKSASTSKVSCALQRESKYTPEV
jgi:hypothetical protein